MRKNKVIKTLKEMGIRESTISFYTDLTADCPDVFYGICDICGEKCNVVQCTALTIAGELIELDISEQLVHGHVGKLAGTF